jgi:hypothetical protein
MRIVHLLQLGCIGAATASGFAAPLDLTKVASDSKWLVHLDFDAFRKTKVGLHVNGKIVQPKIDQSESLKKANLSISLNNISSITAYGSKFEKNGNGVLMITTSADVKKDLDTLCGISSLSGGEVLKLDTLQPYPIYSFKGDVFIAPNINNTVLMAKSKEQLENARKVVLGKGTNMSGSETFSEYPAASNTFFFFGMADGLNESTVIPPQAQVLKETRGGRFVLGEKEDKVFANLIFKGKNEESALKIQQVFQGIVALVSLSQDNPDVTELARSAQIVSNGQNVTISVQFPVSKALQHLDERAGE